MGKLVFEMFLGGLHGICVVLTIIFAFFGFGTAILKGDGTWFFGTLAACCLTALVAFSCRRILDKWGEPKIR